MKRYLICLLTAGILLCGRAAAAENEILLAQAEALETQQLEQALEGTDADGLETGDWTVVPDLNAGLASIWNDTSGEVTGFLREGLRSGLSLVSVVLLTGVVRGLGSGSGSNAVKYIPLAGALAVTTVSAADLNALIGLGRRAIGDMNAFSKVLLPTLASASAAGGAVTSAPARYVATAWFADILITLIEELLLPLVYAYIAVCAADAAFGEGMLSRLSALIRRLTVWILSLLLTVFSAYLSFTGIIAGTADATTLKMAKNTISAAVPVVGGILSDAAETLLAGAGMLRNAVGVFGALAIIALCLSPFLRLGIHYVFYKLSAAVSGTVGSQRTVKLIDDLAGAFGIVLGMTAACALLLFISIISMITVVSSG